MAKAAISVYLRDAVEEGFKFIERRFASVVEMTESFRRQRAWIYEHLQRKADYKRRLARLLEVIKMHSCKFVGISYLTENSMAEVYERLHKSKISKRTVHSMVAHLRELGFLSVIPTKRGNGKQSANILVMERMEAAEQQMVAGEEPALENLAHKESGNLHTKKAPSPSKLPVAKATVRRMASKRPRTKQQEGGKRLLNLVPQWFQERIGCCAREPKAVHEYWKVAKHLSQRLLGGGVDAGEMQPAVQAAVREFFRTSKAAAKGVFTMANPYGFFHSVLEAEMTAHIRRRAQEVSPVLYDWLAE